MVTQQHGGYRKPSHPAPVSNPGAGSKRTDGGPSDTQAHMQLPDAKYGEQANYQEIQSGAPVAGSPDPTPPPAPQAIPMTADTQRPDEPVTAGSPLGAGIGPAAAGIDNRTPTEQDASALRDVLPMLEYLAGRPDSSPSTRAMVLRLRGGL